jgi:hypothetical protein
MFKVTNNALLIFVKTTGFCVIFDNIETYIQGRCRLMYIQYINLLDKSFRVSNVFLDEQEQFRVFVVFKRGISK